ncbi:DeoR/GlpR transcriptional regulator [Rosenbergiella australiborealis]|uniref:DeoR/GlpR transcriptional regulator n=2 Tax=Rosenbergiella TaxID=1356488 RepID=A0ABS5T6P4_9GAMM|nr:DNA-binding transcriptional regulator YciT [Rosenbergiella australiborealis]MBT0728034.1 DeoR/GlpR transcriptional regulator [Rosenbergiella australiborealis]
MNNRHEKIIQLVNDRGSITVNELSQVTGVSEVTIRQDLNILDRGGYVKRIHGSAVAPESDDVSSRMRTRYAVKQSLAEFAASQISEGESVFIEGGSTNALLARTLSSRSDLTIITVSHYIAHLLRDSKCEVVILGGQFQKCSESVVGPLTRYCVQQLHFHKAFIGVDGWHPETGFTGRDMLRCDVVNTVMGKATHTVALTDSSKFGLVHPYPLSMEHKFKQVITDDGLSIETREALVNENIQVELVERPR